MSVPQRMEMLSGTRPVLGLPRGFVVRGERASLRPCPRSFGLFKATYQSSAPEFFWQMGL
jgi:hypothetical protein